MLVACQLVNLTTWECAEPVWRQLRARYPDPGAFARARRASVRKIIKGLGLGDVRSRRLVAMAKAWTSRVPLTASDVLHLPGCGKYASDSWAIFVDRRTDVEPNDGKLNWYLEQVRAGTTPGIYKAV